MTAAVDVLIVEDEAVVREAGRKILAEDGLSVAIAGSVDEAVERLETTRFRLVLSDLKLPGSSGLDLLELARRRWPGVEVVIITGYATLDNALATFRLGGFDFVAKPFDVGELLGVTRRALRYAADPPRLRASAANGAAESSFYLGRHSWARVLPDGSATLGVAETFPNLLDAVESIELPAPQDRVTQGRLLVRILTPGGVPYLVWSPLSGIVLTANTGHQGSTELIDRDPFGTGWLVRIIPDDLNRELALLDDRRQGAPEPALRE